MFNRNSIAVLLLSSCVFLTLIMENSSFRKPTDPDDIDTCLEKNNKSIYMFSEQFWLCGMTPQYMNDHYDEWSARNCKRIKRTGFPECYDPDLNRIYDECAVKTFDPKARLPLDNITKDTMKKFVKHCKDGKPQWNYTVLLLLTPRPNAMMMDEDEASEV